MTANVNLRRGEGYGGRPWTPGTTIWEAFTPALERQINRNAPELTTKEAPRGRFVALTILTAAQDYIAEEGMSLGVGDESGYIYSATARPATAEESAPLLRRLSEQRERQATVQVLRESVTQLLALARAAGTLKNNHDMPAPSRGEQFREKYESWIVAGDTCEYRTDYTIDVVNVSAVATDPELAARMRDAIARLNVGTSETGA